MARGLNFPLRLMRYTRRKGCARYPRRLSDCAASQNCCGVLHRMLSTPGVRAPLLVITRCTASHLADRARVSMRQSTLTLPQRFSRTAWAIRLCSRFTSPRAFNQSISSQGLASLVERSVSCLNAPAAAQRSTAVFCFFKFSFAFRVSHPQELQRKSAPSRVGPTDPIRSVTERPSLLPGCTAGCLSSAPCGNTSCRGLDPQQQTTGLPRFVRATLRAG